MVSHKGAWSSGMTGVSKTLSGSSILSAPGEAVRNLRWIADGFFVAEIKNVCFMNTAYKSGLP